MHARLIALLLLGLVIGSASSADQLSSFGYWSHAQIHDLEKTLHAKVGGPRKNAVIDLADYDASAVAVARREADGPGEAHEHIDDYLIVQSGAATLITGGSILNGKETAPGETRGDAIDGGERVTLAPGDVVHIPARVPHRMLLDDGKSITYFIVKVKVNRNP